MFILVLFSLLPSPPRTLPYLLFTSPVLPPSLLLRAHPPSPSLLFFIPATSLILSCFPPPFRSLSAPPSLFSCSSPDALRPPTSDLSPSVLPSPRFPFSPSPHFLTPFPTSPFPFPLFPPLFLLPPLPSLSPPRPSLPSPFPSPLFLTFSSSLPTLPPPLTVHRLTPPPSPADHLERFAVYRRDVADTLVNAYYILRDDLLAFYVADVAARLDARAGWEDIEATLHCLRAVHEALDPDAAGANPALARLFGAGVFGRLPVSYGAEEYRGGMGVPGGGHGGGMGLGLGEEREREEREAIARVRRTALGLVDTYSAYFTTQPPEALGAPLRYVLGALADPEPGVCLQGALALRSLCDANRRALAGQIGAFAEVHAGIGGVPDSEKGKVLQSIASVIQALPPAEGVGPVEALVRPVLQRLAEALGAAGAHPEPARLAAILQLEILAGIARGLTRTADPLAFDEDDGGGEEGEAVRVAREDPRSGALRNGLFEAIAQVAELWSADSEVGQALSELFRAITALPADVTLLSLPAQPLLSVVCRAAGRRLTAVWLALATILIAQLNPPPMILTLQSAPSPEAEAGVRGAVGEIVGAALTVLGAPGGMVENPDIVQEFFACMDRVAQDFTGAFCALPDGAFDALMQCAISALALQERYSLVAACTFLGTLIHRTALYAAISPELLQQLQAHMIRVHGRAIMRAVLCGFAGAAPRSVTSNLLELLGALVGRWDERAVSEAEGGAAGGYAPQGGRGTHVGGGARGWVPGVVFADDFFPSKAGQDAKERFVKTVVSSRSVKKTKEAANQFAIVAWGLEGSTFGYSSA
ncbi:hypothetical protein B0H11DRAFT_808219 [Mycena galericulata]|nr:hypothetical protein B0H11DRAFT_808219 [Mycena galericulata]